MEIEPEAGVNTSNENRCRNNPYYQTDSRKIILFKKTTHINKFDFFIFALIILTLLSWFICLSKHSLKDMLY